MTELPTLRKQPKILIAADACCLEVVLDDEDRDFTIRRDDYWPQRPSPTVSAMAALLILKGKSRAQENTLDRLPIDWRQPRHRLLCPDREFASFDRNPGWALPCSVRATFVTGLIEHLIERPCVYATPHKCPHGLVNRAPRGLGADAGAGHIERHGVGNELVAFAPDLNGVVDVHPDNSRTAACTNQAVTLQAASPR